MKKLQPQLRTDEQRQASGWGARYDIGGTLHGELARRCHHQVSSGVCVTSDYVYI